jgi:hypothetical protein
MTTVVDEFDKGAMRRVIYNLHATGKQLVIGITAISSIYENAILMGLKVSENPLEGAWMVPGI